MTPPGHLHSAPLARLISDAPKLRDAAAASARIEAWLDAISADDRAPLSTLLKDHPRVHALLAGLAEGSPFLWELASCEPARLISLLTSHPAQHFAALLTEGARAASQARDDATVMRVLRRMKAEGALLIALADIGGVWHIMRATQAITALADAATKAAVDFALREAAARGRIRPVDPDNPSQRSGYIVLAMGKMGAFELNYSSDIDLIVFFDRESPLLPEDAVPATTFVRITQRVVKLMQERTGDGYVFRTDVRLRPDPASTAIAISTAAAMSYYESVGQNWERAMMIKARACAGDIPAGEKLLQALSPFVWRKYLDYAAVADIQAMKRQINAFCGHAVIAVEGHNIKLGRGGIREIEFFAQIQQLIAGGRNADLRDRDTLTTLDKLAADRWIDAGTRDAMKEAYCFLRRVEHRLQMVRDEQTQTLPDDREGMERFARFAGYDDRDSFAAVLTGHLDRVQNAYANLFERSARTDALDLVFAADRDDRKTLDHIVEWGFRAPLEVSATIRSWFSGGHRALRGQAAPAHLKALLPDLLEQFGRTDNPNASLVRFDQFLANLHAPARLLSLLRQKPELIALLVLVLGTAPRLADTLARSPQVMDALVDPVFFGALPDESDLGRRLEERLAQSAYAEDLLERIRTFGLEYMFLIGVRILTGTVTARQAGEAFARLADAVIRAVHRTLAVSFAGTYGHLQGEETAILAMGKLGGYEMTASSDLDLILVYDFDAGQPESDGARKLYGGQYFARLTQRLINALTAQTNYGALYQVDMRLRPSGRAGPLATHIEGFSGYQETEAWTWEHMALTRARVVSASPAFRAHVESVVAGILRRQRNAGQIAGDVVEMRAAIAQERGPVTRWDIKHAPGGLVDIEFIAQYLQLIHAHAHPDVLDTSTARVLDKAYALKLIAVDDAEGLRGAVQLYQDLTQVLRLCLPAAFDPKTAGAELLRLLSRAAGVPDFATLDATLIETQAKVRASFVTILGKEP